MSEAISEGHGLDDVSCDHGSRWKWWPGESGKGEWMQVVFAPGCECGHPPRPFHEEAEG